MIGLFSPVQPGSEGCPPKMCADEVADEDEGQVGLSLGRARPWPLAREIGISLL